MTLSSPGPSVRSGTWAPPCAPEAQSYTGDHSPSVFMDTLAMSCPEDATSWLSPQSLGLTSFPPPLLQCFLGLRVGHMVALFRVEHSRGTVPPIPENRGFSDKGCGYKSKYLEVVWHHIHLTKTVAISFSLGPMAFLALESRFTEPSKSFVLWRKPRIQSESSWLPL